jgi:hypothetical protein
MRPRLTYLFLVLLLLAVGCVGYRISQRDVLLALGEEAPVVVEEGRWFSGTVNYYPVALHSTDENVARVTSTGTSTTLVRGLHTGTAYLANSRGEPLVTVTVFECPPISLGQSPAEVATLPGKKIDLTVAPKGYQWLSLQWFEERNGAWQTIPFATVTSFTVAPAKAGIYRFQARYHDRCGDATATFLVNVTDRVRAVR